MSLQPGDGCTWTVVTVVNNASLDSANTVVASSLWQLDSFRCWQKTATYKNEVCLLPKQFDDQVAKLHFPSSLETRVEALVRAQVKALDFKRNYGLMKRDPDLLQRTFSFSDAHAVAIGISSLLTVRSCRLQSTSCRKSSMRNWGSCTFLHSVPTQTRTDNAGVNVEGPPGLRAQLFAETAR